MECGLVPGGGRQRELDERMVGKGISCVRLWEEKVREIEKRGRRLPAARGLRLGFVNYI